MISSKEVLSIILYNIFTFSVSPYLNISVQYPLFFSALAYLLTYIIICLPIWLLWLWEAYKVKNAPKQYKNNQSNHKIIQTFYKTI